VFPRRRSWRQTTVDADYPATPPKSGENKVRKGTVSNAASLSFLESRTKELDWMVMDAEFLGRMQ
jgi:hypothetical protein